MTQSDTPASSAGTLDEQATETTCDRYCDKHAACRLMNGQPVHYFDCDRFEVYNYGTKQGKCDCTATADVNAILAAPNGT